MRTLFSTLSLIVIGVLLLPQSASAQSTANLNRKFATKVTVEVESEPISDFFKRMSKEHKVVIDVDKEAPTKKGFSLDDPISLSLKEVSLFTALKLAAESLDFVCIPQGKKVHVTTYTAMREKLYEQQYSFPWLRPLNIDPRNLAEKIEYTTAGPWFQLDAEGGDFSTFAQTAFKVTQNWENHQQISQILAGLQSIISGRGQLKRNPNEVRIEKALQTLVEIEAGEQPLETVLSQLLTENEINSWVDTSELRKERIKLSDSVKIMGGKKRIVEHLAELLSPLKLAAFIDGEVVKISTQYVFEESMVVRVYDVRKQIVKVGTAEAVADILIKNEDTGIWFPVDQVGGNYGDVGPLLVILHTNRAHKIISGMLKQ